jgi:two-component system response regulator FixJ
VSASAETIVIIDDHSGIRGSLRAFLETSGLNVRDYASAPAYLKSNDWGHCLLVDVRMPEMGGLELQQELTRRQIMVPTIVMTGHGDVPLAVRAMRSGAVDFLEKPFDDNVLLEAVQRALTESRVSRDRAAATRESKALLENLTDREREVFRQLVTGKSNKLVAHALGISPRTVEVHRARLQEKLKAQGLSDLVRIANAAYLLSPDT